MIAVHISNRFLDLAPSLAATVQTIPGLKGVVIYPKTDLAAPDGTSSRVAYLTRDAATLAAITAAWPQAQALDPQGAGAWTDDYSNVFSALFAGAKTP